MALRDYGRRPYVMAAPLAFMLYSLGLMISIISSPTLDLSNLSALGGSSNEFTAVSFGVSCFVAGSLVAVYGIGKILFENFLNKVSGSFFILGGVFLVLVGFFDSDTTLRLHNTVTIYFMLCMIVAIGCASVSDIMDGDMKVLITCVAMVVIILIQWPFLSGAMSECVAIGLATIWSFVQTAKYMNSEKRAADTALVD